MSLHASLHDLRYALRSLRKSPGFTAVAVLTLALGTGANTAVFSLINAVLLRPLPYPESDRLVLVWESAPFFGLRDSPVAPANYADWKARSRSFEEIGALEDHTWRLTGDGAPEVVNGGLVTAGVFRALRVRPVLGRVFRDEEDQPGATAVLVISDGFWRRRFGGDPDVIGKAITVNERKHTVVGVLPPGVEPPSEYSGGIGELWAPFGSVYTASDLAARGRHNWMVAARLRPRVTLAAANAEMEAVGAALARQYPDTNEKVGAFVAPLREHFVASSRRVLLLLLGAVALVLLIACSNLANLLLSRADHRRKEIAVRAALGAGPWQLVCQSFLESLLLCLAGAAGGLLLAATTLSFLAHLAPGDLSGLKGLSIDWLVLAFSLALAVLTALVFGLIPLLDIRRLDILHGLKLSARTLAAAGSRRLRGLLICSEVAFAFVLLIAAGLLVQTVARLRGVDPGCRTNNVLTLELPASQARRAAGGSVAWQRELLGRILAIPGVESAGFTNHIPLSFKGDITGIGAEGRDPKERFQCRSRFAGPGYLRTMGIPIRRGRDVDERDGPGAPLVVVINETLARLLWRDQDPIGRKLVFGTDLRVPVIGVCGDVRQSGLDVPPRAEFYISALQAPQPPDSLAIHTRVDPASVAGAVRQAVWSLDPNQPVTSVATMEQILDREVFQRRVQTTLLGVFAGLALLLAAIGLYGVLSYLVGRQLPELGIRMALGAAPADILRLIVGHGVSLTFIGIAYGVAGALIAGRLLGAVLFGVKATDPVTYLAVAGALLLTGALASYLPARRALRVDPVTTLREE